MTHDWVETWEEWTWERRWMLAFFCLLCFFLPVLWELGRVIGQNAALITALTQLTQDCLPSPTSP